MNNTTILKPIGKGQYTPPLEWRKKIGIENKPVKATLKDGKIILEPLAEEKISWDIKRIDFDILNQETQEAIKESEKNYKAGKTDEFESHDEFWNEL